MKIGGKSLGLFSPHNRFRDFCSRVCQHNAFDFCISLIIFLSSIQFILESPLSDPESTMMKVLQVLELIYTGIFVLEACIKIVAFGFIFNGENSYLKKPWN